MKDSKILIVEDEAIVSMDLKSRLEKMGYCVVGTCACFEEAINLAEAKKPDVVLMDIMLKGNMDGISAAEKLQKEKYIPVIYLTAYSDELTLSRARESEPYGYLLKPFDERELHTTIEMAIHKHKMDRRLRDNEQWLKVTLKCIGDALIATDKNGLVAYMNSVAESLTGWTISEARGKDLNDVMNLIDIKTRTHIQNPAQTIIQQKSLFTFPKNTALISRNGEERCVEDSGSPIIDESGKILGVVVVFRDITEKYASETVFHEHTDFLSKRARELHCLYEIIRLISDNKLTFEAMLKRIANVIPSAMQYPEITCVRIRVEDTSVQTENFQKTPWELSEEIIHNAKSIGFLEVYYLEERPQRFDGPFLREEKDLIHAVSSQLKFALDYQTHMLA
jgi:PAS domain S-box-containing protein